MKRAQYILEVVRKAKKKGGPVLTLKALKESTQNMREKINKPRSVSIRKVSPLAGNKTLTISGEALGNKLYPVTITFYNVDFSTVRDEEHPLTAHVGDLNKTFFMEQVTEEDHPVQLRCQCPDFFFVWAYHDRKKKALSGRNFPRYVRKTMHMPERNPSQSPGLCKHLVGLVERLGKDRILKKASRMNTRPGNPKKVKSYKTSAEVARAFNTR